MLGGRWRRFGDQWRAGVRYPLCSTREHSKPFKYSPASAASRTLPRSRSSQGFPDFRLSLWDEFIRSRRRRRLPLSPTDRKRSKESDNPTVGASPCRRAGSLGDRRAAGKDPQNDANSKRRKCRAMSAINLNADSLHGCGQPTIFVLEVSDWAAFAFEAQSSSQAEEFTSRLGLPGRLRSSV
jgi:hypothetical protein